MKHHLFGTQTIILAMLLGLSSVEVHATNMFEDEDTILVEKQPEQKIPYGRIVRKISEKLFNLDTHKILSFGEGKTRKVARSFKDFTDRSKYRIKLRTDEVQLKYTLNF